MGGGFMRLRRVDQRGHDHNSVDPHALRLLCHLLGKGGGEFSDAGDNRDFAPRRVLRHFNDLQLFLRTQGGVFPDAAAHHQPGNAIFHQVFHHRVGGV
jgi:hypothetical protein